MRVKNNTIVSLMICLLPLIFTCGMAQEEGVNAPEGSTVSLPADDTVKTNVFPVRYWITLTVYGPNVTGSGGGETIVGTAPLSFIQVQLICTTGCTLYDKTSGDWITPASTMESKTIPYFIKTNKYGWYQFEARMSGIGDYYVTANINLASDQMKITVENL